MDARELRFRIDEDIERRPFVEGDADGVFAAVRENRDHLTPFMQWMVDDYSIDHAREFIAQSIRSATKMESLGFGIFRKEKFIGTIGFVYFDWKVRSTEIGYWIAANEEGKGIITRAGEILIDHAIREWGINRIEIRCSTLNTRSDAVPERLGFSREGLLRQSQFRNGTLHDFYIYGLLAAEWKGLARKT
jgi:ribosomal-protein-serine acetyltransferase